MSNIYFNDKVAMTISYSNCNTDKMQKLGYDLGLLV